MQKSNVLCLALPPHSTWVQHKRPTRTTTQTPTADPTTHLTQTRKDTHKDTNTAFDPRHTPRVVNQTSNNRHDTDSNTHPILTLRLLAVRPPRRPGRLDLFLLFFLLSLDLPRPSIFILRPALRSALRSALLSALRFASRLRCEKTQERHTPNKVESGNLRCWRWCRNNKLTESGLHLFRVTHFDLRRPHDHLLYSQRFRRA